MCLVYTVVRISIIILIFSNNLVDFEGFLLYIYLYILVTSQTRINTQTKNYKKTSKAKTVSQSRHYSTRWDLC